MKIVEEFKGIVHHFRVYSLPYINFPRDSSRFNLNLVVKTHDAIEFKKEGGNKNFFLASIVILSFTSYRISFLFVTLLELDF